MLTATNVHEVHSSEIRAFLECRRQWDLQYRERWAPKKMPKPLEFGRAWHVALEELYQPDLWIASTKEELYQRALLAFQQELERQKTGYLERIGAYVLEPEDTVDYNERFRLGKNMLYNVVRNTDKDRYTPIAVEEEFETPVTNTDGYTLTCCCPRCYRTWCTSEQWRSNIDYGWNGLPVYFRCRIDAIFQDQAGSRWVVDHKSAAQLLNKEDVSLLQRDIQIGPYLWAAWKNDLAVCGAVYNQFRKVYPKPPRRLDVPQEGRLFSVNRMQITDFYTARRYFKAYDLSAYRRGLYTDYLQWLKADGKKDFFRQFAIFKTPAQLSAIGLQVARYIEDMTSEYTTAYPNPTSTITCKRCFFNEPCLSMYEATPTTEILEELQENFITEPLLWYEQERLERRIP